MCRLVRGLRLSAHIHPVQLGPSPQRYIRSDHQCGLDTQLDVPVATPRREGHDLRLEDCPHNSAFASHMVLRFGSDRWQFPDDHVRAKGNAGPDCCHSMAEVEEMS